MNVQLLSQNNLPSLMTAMEALTLDADFSHFFKKAANAVQHILGADGTALIMLDDSGDFFEYKLFEGERQTLLGHFKGMRFPAHEGVCGRTLRAKHSIFVQDYPADPDAMAALVDAGLCANLTIPLMSGEQVIGVLASSWFDQSQPQVSPKHLALAERIANQVAVACHREKLETRLRALVDTDPLTGLYNRHGIMTRLDTFVNTWHDQQRPFAVFFIDIDGLKSANDHWGHELGDCLLRDAACRLIDVTRKGDCIGRLGGDEFLVIAECTEAYVDTLAKRFLQALHIHFGSGRKRGRLSGSIGIALAPGDGDDAMSLLRKADAAMYSAKLSGGDSFERASHLGNTREDRQVSIVDIEGALDRDELQLWYQPIVNITSAEVTGFEALLRWHKSDTEIISAGPIIAAIESARSDIQNRLGTWVLHAAARQILAWSAQGMGADLHINISARHFLHPSFLLELQKICGYSPRVGDSLIVEITETAMLEDLERAKRIMLGCRALGVRMAIDDFGTGYASLTYLKRLPLDIIKIDRTFVAELRDNPVDQAIVQGVVSIARALGLLVVAEGAEDSAQCEALRALGCDQLQGYYICRPMPIAALSQWLSHKSQADGGVAWFNARAL